MVQRIALGVYFACFSIGTFSHARDFWVLGLRHYDGAPILLEVCLIPRFDGAILSLEGKEAMWDKYVTGAPRPGCTRNWVVRPPPRLPANVSGSMPPDTLVSNQTTIMKEPDSTSDR